MRKTRYLFLGLLLLANTSMYGQMMKLPRIITESIRSSSQHGVPTHLTRLASYRKLTPFPHYAFTTPISQSLLSQPFAVLAKQSFPAMPSIEQTLLLTHKFIAEYNTYPRTIIAVEGHILPMEQYTPTQILEVKLGKQLKSVLEDTSIPNSNPARAELLSLRYDFSPKYTGKRILDNLNAWIDTHQSWPKMHEDPQNFVEQYETALAYEANQILARAKFTNLPEEIVQNMQEVRSYYDPTYAQEIRALLEELEDWIAVNGHWPRKEIAHEDPISPLTQAEISEIAFARRMERLAKKNIPSTWPKDLVDEIYQVREYYTSSPLLRTATDFPFSATKGPIFSPEETQALFKNLELWITTHNRWPRSRLSKTVIDYTPDESYETTLGSNIERFVLYSHPKDPNIWLPRPVFTHAKSVLHTGTPYRGNPNLEQVRKLYYYATYLKIQKDKGYLPENYYENFENWFNELKTLFPHDPYKDIELE